MEKLTFGHKTATGRTRKTNQDSYAVVSREDLGGLADGLFVVADGMGGRAGGEIASRVTVETVPKVVLDVLSEDKHLEPPERMRSAVHEALLAANEAVFGQAKANPELRGMGTTCVAVLVHGDKAAVGNIGDSRVYLLRDGGFRPLTHDHSLVAQHLLAGELTEEEARGSRYRNIITRAIGIAEAVEPDVELVRLHSGDTLLLCSDGLTNMLTDTEIARILARGDDPEVTCNHLVGSANAAGGLDNITAVVLRYGSFIPVDIVEDEEGAEEFARPVPYPQPARRSAWRYVPIPLLFAVVAIAWFMLSQYELHMTPPYLRERKEITGPAVVTLPKPAVNYSLLDYAEPKTLINRPIRGSFLSVTPSGRVTVIDAADNELVRWEKGTTKQTGLFVTIDNTTKGPGLVEDPDGNTYVVSRPDKAIHKYDQRKRIDVICAGKLADSEAIGIDALGNLYVIDGKKLKKIEAKPAKRTGGGANAPR